LTGLFDDGRMGSGCSAMSVACEVFVLFLLVWYCRPLPCRNREYMILSRRNFFSLIGMWGDQLECIYCQRENGITRVGAEMVSLSGVD